MGYWGWVRAENRQERERQAKWPRWLHILRQAANAASWVALAAIVLWGFGFL